MVNGKLIMVVLAVLYALAMPLAVLFWWKKKTGCGLWPYIVGAFCFLAFAMGLEQISHMLCLVNDNPVSRAINSNAVLYGIYGAFAAGIFEETGRLFGYRVLLRKKKNPEISIAYGIGHGGIEVLLIFGLTYLIYLLALCGVSFGSSETDVSLIATVGQIKPVTALIAAAERIFAMMVHIGLSVVVFYGVRTRRARWFFIAVLLHAATDFPAALFQKGIINSLLLVEAWALLMGVLTLCLGIKLYKIMKKTEIQKEESVSDDDNR